MGKHLWSNGSVFISFFGDLSFFFKPSCDVNCRRIQQAGDDKDDVAGRTDTEQCRQVIGPPEGAEGEQNSVHQL